MPVAARWLPPAFAMMIVATVATDCGSRTIPTSKSPSPTTTTGAGTLVLVTSLHSGPSVSGRTAVAGEDACRGSATVTIDPTPRGLLNLAVARFEISLIGCPPGTALTSVHLHQLPIGTVEEWIGSDLPETVLRTGDGSFTSTNQGVPIARVQEVIAQPTNFYIHFHSKNNQAGGFLRGELTPR